MAVTPALEVEDVRLRFGGVAALDGVTLSVDGGEVVGLIGPNGAGKTSLLNCVSGVSRPDAGSIRMHGKELVGLRPSAVAALGLARTFQETGLFSRLDVLDNLLLGRHRLMRSGVLASAFRLRRMRAEEASHRRACEALIDRFALSPHRHTRVAELPLGVQKRVEVARALAMEPRVLVLDEPFAGLAPVEARDLVRTVTDLHDERDLTTVVVAHDVALVWEVADRVVVLDFGKVIATGPPAQLRRDQRVVEAYVGSSLKART